MYTPPQQASLNTASRKQKSFFTTSSTPQTDIPFFQPKLSVGPVDDVYEREADAVADRVMRMPDTPATPAPPVQRKCAHCEEEEKNKIQRKPYHTHTGPEAPTSVSSALQSGSQSLDGPTRSFMESHIGHDFSHVKIHTGSQAAQSAQAINALAYTSGNHIVFNQGQYAPASASGKKLLAHELTHVVQQRAAGPRVQPRRRMTDIRHPKLVLYQDDAETRFFRNLAINKARELRAVQVDLSNRCPIDAAYGPIAYYSGADIIEILAKVAMCTGHQIEEVHIFSHGNSNVVDASEGTFGRSLYGDDDSYEERDQGGRHVSEIPPEIFSANARIILHGCQIGSGDDSLAERLLRHIVGTSPRARVYGHSQSGTCGRTNDWREFSARHPDGRRIGENPYHRPREE